METAADILQGILALVFLGAGASKVMGTRMQVENFNVYGYPQWFRSVTGLVELTGAAAMLIGLLADEVAIFAGLLLSATMIGAVYTDLFRRNKVPYALAPAILLGLSVAVVVLRVS